MPDAPSWLRVYHSILDNRKTASLSDQDFGLWLRLMLIASRNTPRGQLPNILLLAKLLGNSTYICHKVRLKSKLLEFTNRGLLDNNTGLFSIHNFTSRQWLKNAESDTYIDSTLPVSSTASRDSQSRSFQVSKELTGKPLLFFNGTEQIQSIEGGSVSLSASLFSIYKQYIEYRDSIGISNKATVITKGHRKASLEFIDTWAEIQSITELWNGSPGLQHHRAFTAADREYCKKALITFKPAAANGNGIALSSEIIRRAINRYSLWMIGSKSNKYRPAYSWSFAEFIRHKNGSLIQRLSGDDWEATCLPWESNKKQAPKSIDSLMGKMCD
jgi:hypothetical protein